MWPVNGLVYIDSPSSTAYATVDGLPEHTAAHNVCAATGAALNKSSAALKQQARGQCKRTVQEGSARGQYKSAEGRPEGRGQGKREGQRKGQRAVQEGRGKGRGQREGQRAVQEDSARGQCKRAVQEGRLQTCWRLLRLRAVSGSSSPRASRSVTASVLRPTLAAVG